MNHWVIRSMKAEYRKKVVQQMIDATDNDNSLPTMSIIEAMKILILTLDVSTTTVQNSFK